MDLSKTFDNLSRDLLVSKLHASGFQHNVLSRDLLVSKLHASGFQHNVLNLLFSCLVSGGTKCLNVLMSFSWGYFFKLVSKQFILPYVVIMSRTRFISIHNTGQSFSQFG